MSVKKPLVILAGPTAVGKTQLSIALAKRIGGEIISADSMQVYKRMDIGSAKIRPEEMEGVPHHLIDILEPQEEFNVVTFATMCNECLKGIYDRGHIPILVGGTGFYIQAVLYQIDFKQTDENSTYRKELENLKEQKGVSYLHDMLEKVDPKSAESIHENNVKRVIRALEFYKQTNVPISLHNEEEKEKESAFNSCFFVLNVDRELLYKNIDKRVDSMLENGLLDEVNNLKKEGCHREMVSMQGLGYKEILDYLEHKISLEEAVYLLKRDTRHFAKRQLTWFRREKDVIWLDKNEFHFNNDLILDFMVECLTKKLIL